MSTQQTDRRDFLKTSAAAAAGTLALASGVHAAGSDIIKVGLVGCGGRGSGAVVDNLQADPGLRLVAVGDAFEDRAKGLLGRLAGDEDIKKKLDVKPDHMFIGLDAHEKVIAACDLVILATPPGFRPLHLQAAVAAGKNIFTEKPVGVDGPGIRKVLAAYEDAKAKNLAIVAGTQRRHQTSYNASMERIHEGAIGKLVAGRCYWNQGALWHRKREQNMSDLAWQLRNWLYFTWLSGDHIVEQHVHNLDVMNWALAGHPVKCVGMGGREVRKAEEFGQIFDHFAIDYEYPDNVHVLSMCRQIAGTKGEVSEALAGSAGTWTSHGHKITGQNAWEFGGKQGRKDNLPYKQEHKDLIKSIRDGKPLNELKQVAESTLTAIMGRMSAYTGQEVTWEQALNSKLDLVPDKVSWEMSLPVPPVAVPGVTKLI